MDELNVNLDAAINARENAVTNYINYGRIR